MTDGQAEKVCAACRESIRRERLGFVFDVGNPKHLDILVQKTRRHPRLRNEKISDLELRECAALCALGPGSIWVEGKCLESAPDPPPGRILNHFHACLRHSGCDAARVMELAVAYACGRGRLTHTGSERWDTEWRGGIHALARAIYPAVAECDRWLEYDARVPNHPKRDKLLLWQDAFRLAMVLIFPTNRDGPMSLCGGDTLTICCDEPAEVRFSGKSYAQDHRIQLPPGSRMVFELLGFDAELVGPHSTVRVPVGAVVTVNSQDNATWATARSRVERDWHLSDGDTLSITPGVTGTCSRNHAPAQSIRIPVGSALEIAGGSADCLVVHNGHGHLMQVDGEASCLLKVKMRSAEFTCVETPGRQPCWSGTAPVGSEITVTGRGGDARVTAAVPVERGVRLVSGQTATMTGPFDIAVRECACGTAECERRHRLSSWVAAAVSLWAFVASAVKGPSRSITLGSFAQGMYAALLCTEGYAL